MGAITGTLAVRTEFGGDYKAYVINATIGATSDTITLSQATHGISEIVGVFGQISGGMDADFQALQISFSGLVITVVSKQADGAAADDFTGTTIQLLVIGKSETASA